jgi:hypothetical protein
MKPMIVVPDTTDLDDEDAMEAEFLARAEFDEPQGAEGLLRVNIHTRTPPWGPKLPAGAAWVGACYDNDPMFHRKPSVTDAPPDANDIEEDDPDFEDEP